MSNNLIDRLKQQETALKEKIRNAQKQQARKIQAIEVKKARIYGAAFMSALKDNPALKDQLNPIIDRYTTNNNERKLLGLEPLEKAAPTGNENINNEPVQTLETTSQTQPVEEDKPKPTGYWKS